MMKSKILIGLVLGALVSPCFADNSGDIKSIEVHGDLMKNKNVQNEVKEIAKAGNIENLDIKKMQEKNCNMVFYPLDGSDLKHGAYWQDKYTCERHYGTVIPSKKARQIGIYNGLWSRITKNKTEYADTKLTIKRSNKCFFLEKGKNGWRRNEWKATGDRTVELHIGLFSDKGAEMGLSGTQKNKDAWNVFNSPLNCSETPSSEEWTVHQKLNGRWIETGHAKFYIQK